MKVKLDQHFAIHWHRLKVGLCVLFLGLACGGCESSDGVSVESTERFANCREINFEDPAIEVAVRDALSSPEGELDIDRVRGLVQLDLSNSNLGNVEGLQCLSGLRRLDLSWNKISDLGPLAELTRLEVLDLSWNQVEDIAPLGRLKHLQELDLAWNGVERLGPLDKLDELEILIANDNRIRDLEPIWGLDELDLFDGRGNPLGHWDPSFYVEHLTWAELPDPILGDSIR